MKRKQWLTIAVSLVLVLGLYAATQQQIFGSRNAVAQTEHNEHDGHDHSADGAHQTEAVLTTDTILSRAKAQLKPDQQTRINFLENSIVRGDVRDQKLHLYHQLARFWYDSARVFEPYAWFTAEAARLENSEKSLTFAARLFLQAVEIQQDPAIQKWEAQQAKDLFERSLKLNPDNDSAKIELGAVYLYGGIAMPMEGIKLIREVADKDPENAYAQLTLGKASLISGQLDKALERFKNVVEIDPQHLEATLRIAETEEQLGNKKEAVRWYEQSLSLSENQVLKEEVKARIARLK